MPNRPKILLVDGHRQRLSELEQWLSYLDADLVLAFSGEQALGQTQQEHFCSAFVAFDLPDMDGTTLLALLRAQPNATGLPVILLHAAYPNEQVYQKGYRAGAADILSRPLIPGVIVSKARNYISLAQRFYSPDGETRTIQNVRGKDAEELFCWLSQSMEQIAHAMAATLEMVEVPHLVLDQLPEVVPYERGSILLREGDTLRIVAQRGFPPGWPAAGTRIPIRQGDIFQQIVETRQALLIVDVTATSAWQQAEGLPLNRSWLGVPLLSNDQVIGMVSLTRREADAFRPEEVSLLHASASQAAVALVNASLLNDLKHFNEQLEQLVQQRTEELKQAYAKLEKIDQTKTAFISVAAHELRTPLTLIQGYASLLGTVISPNNDASGLVEGILNGEKRLLDIVNSMIDVSMIDTQALTVRKSSVNIWLVLKLLASEFQPALKGRNITLSIRETQKLPEIQADTELLTKLFRQLIGNAIKYTPDGGSISVEGSLLPAKKYADVEGPAVEIRVRDTGIGIHPADQELIFDKFYQLGSVELHSSGKTKFKGGGPGLGLSIARGVARAHGGRIWAESPGQDEETCPGSCFHVVLPIE